MSEMMSTPPIKVVVAKPGLDGHDRGAKVVARALRDAGMEVIYTGIFQTPESILRAVIQEDAAVLGLSSLSGAHMELFGEVLRLMLEQGLDDVILFGGGIIPPDDADRLRGQGVAAIFGPGSSLAEIVAFVEGHVRPERVA